IPGRINAQRRTKFLLIVIESQVLVIRAESEYSREAHVPSVGINPAVRALAELGELIEFCLFLSQDEAHFVVTSVEVVEDVTTILIGGCTFDLVGVTVIKNNGHAF